MENMCETCGERERAVWEEEDIVFSNCQECADEAYELILSAFD